MIVVVIACKVLVRKVNSKGLHRLPGASLAFRSDMKNRTSSDEQKGATVQQKRPDFFQYKLILMIIYGYLYILDRISFIT